MKISKSKQELARIISENGGWLCADFAAQQDDGELWFSSVNPEWNTGCGCFSIGYEDHFTVGTLIQNRHQCILSSAEYFHLYPEPNADGWIEWKGGECPVEKGTLVDVIWRDGRERIGVKALHIGGAGHQFWVADGMINDIIAYRLHNPEQDKPRFCESVMRSIPEPTAKPTIEQLAADYRSAKDYAERKQQEVDAAKADAEARLKALELAGEAIGLLVSQITAKQEPELAITDWRDLQTGGLVLVEEEGGLVAEGEYEVLEVEVPDYDGKRTIRIRGGEGCQFWINYENGWRFIRRP